MGPRQVAIKVLDPEIASEVGPERFLREIEIAAGLQHPNILPLHDSGASDGLLYYVMPYVEGESLAHRIERDGQLPLEDALQIAREVADGLGYAHEQGVVHRDVKPGNILLSRGRPIIADFGIARAVAEAGRTRVTETGHAVGTPSYMSPEQASGDDVDARSDIYSLGCVLYEMLAGEPPFTGPTGPAVIARHLVEDPPALDAVRPEVPAAVSGAIAAALAKLPADRIATASELSAALEAPASWRPRRRRRRVKRTAAIVGAGLAVTVAVVVVFASGLFRSPAVPLDPNKVVVLPFRVVGTDPDLREGMLDLFDARFTGEGGPRGVNVGAVMAAWRRAGGSDSTDLPAEAAFELAKRFEAGRVLLGGIVGSSQRMEMNATLYDVGRGEELARASAAGQSDDILSLVDELAAELLILEAGEPGPQLADLTTDSLEALREYLEGRKYDRRGQWDQAWPHFKRALEIDSTFALAALAYMESTYPGGGTQFGEAREKAWALRDRLSPANRLYLEAFVGPDYPEGILGAPKLGIEDAHEEAERRLTRALELGLNDIAESDAARGLLQLAALAGDTAEVRRMGERYFSVVSPDAPHADFIRWRMAVALNDTATLADLRSRFNEVGSTSLFRIIGTAQLDGIALEDADCAAEAWRRRVEAGEERVAGARRVFKELALNRGRPQAAEEIHDEFWDGYPYADEVSRFWAQLHRIEYAVDWDGDTLAAAEAYRALEPLAAEQPDDESGRQTRLTVLAYLVNWKLAHGDLTTAARWTAELRAAGGYWSWLAIFYEQFLADLEGRPVSKEAVDSLDSYALTHGVFNIWNLSVAYLREAHGDLEGALAAVRRRAYHFDNVDYLSTMLREEGRLAALVGDREGAIRAYRHYLALRSDPEPGLVPQVERVRAELARLVGESGRN
jgi:serine/threonine-protein kinase